MFKESLYSTIDEYPAFRGKKKNMNAVIALAEQKMSFGHDALILSYLSQKGLYHSMDLTENKTKDAIQALCQIGILVKLQDAQWKKSYALYEVAEEFVDAHALKLARDAQRRRLHKQTLAECETVNDAWHWLRRSLDGDSEKTLEVDYLVREKAFDNGVRRITIKSWKAAYSELFSSGR